MAAKLKGISRLKKSEKQADEYPDELWKFMSPSEKAKFLVADVFSRSSKEPSAVQPGEHKQKGLVDQIQSWMVAPQPAGRA
ncbi:hypothetical protein [Escherichia coli]|uniref:hypothetical protein n=1 Tax=Escherichia coli TaxID=562 RepID=UPI0039E8A3DC